MFQTSYIDPFNIESTPPNLINFASGVVATPKIEASMIGALDKGMAMAEKFVEERLVNYTRR